VPPADRLRRKLTVRAHGRTLVLVKRSEESGEHVVQKALLWRRFLPRYPELRVEQHLPFPSRYKPDLYALDPTGQRPVFWGECGVVSAEKLRALVRTHRDCHFVFSKWATRPRPIRRPGRRGARRRAADGTRGADRLPARRRPVARRRPAGRRRRRARRPALGARRDLTRNAS
jgi:hypothetical protein